MIRDETTNYLINREDISYIETGMRIFPFNIHRGLGIVLIALGISFGIAGIISFYLRPLDETLSIVFSSGIPIILGFILLFIDIKPPERGLRIYKVLGLILVMLGFHPYMWYPSRLLIALISALCGIVLLWVKLNYCCEIQLRSGITIILKGTKEEIEKISHEIMYSKEK